MGFFDKLKALIIKDKNNNIIESYLNQINTFLAQDVYVSVKDKNSFLLNILEYRYLIKYYQTNELLKYCSSKKINYERCLELVEKLNNFDELVKSHNNEYINKHLLEDKKYLDEIFINIDPVIKLDEEQREVILRDEDYTLVVAGAGAGKTTTVAGKVKYLVDKKNIKPEEILVISFTNKAVGELKDRINKDLNVNCAITTFHAAGNAILKKSEKPSYKIATTDVLYKSLNIFLNQLFSLNLELANKLVLFFSYYLEFENVENIEDIKKLREFTYYEDLKSQIELANKQIIEEREKVRVSIKSERLRSLEEVKIANFLYLNGIDYEYEKPYPKPVLNMKRAYLPDFTIKDGDNLIYLEHFGITEDGKNDYYSEDTLKSYHDKIKLKKELHHNNKTKLIYTFSKYNDGIDLLEHLKQLLIENNITFNPRSTKEIYEQLAYTNDNKYFKKMIKLLEQFINNFKTNGWDENHFESLYNSTTSQRDKIFLEIAKEAYSFYQKQLRDANLYDFNDLINESKRILDEVSKMKEKLAFKYIIIDEYQDISLQRFDLAKKLAEITDAKIIAVGDDWQSIYAFAGSQLKLFTDFKKSMGYADILYIRNTYRNSQELINIAGEFIQQNQEQYKKELNSFKNVQFPVVIFSYSDDYKENQKLGKQGVLEEKAKAIEKALTTIVKRNKKENLEILLIGRFGFDAENLSRTELFDYIETSSGKNKVVSKKYPQINIEYMTAHSSKGLGRDEVIIINQDSGTYGFPSKKTNDPVLNMVIYNDRSYEDAEERRLFYVALTRTKNRVYLIAPKHTPSKFLLEIKDNQGVYKDYEFDDIRTANKKLGNYCPHCGFPIYYKHSKAYGLNMYICSNDPEACGFVSNNMKGRKTSIRKCPSCKDGYLFIKKVTNKEAYFLGCTNYQKNGKGCNYSTNLDEEN